MLALAAHRLSISTVILDPAIDAPAKRVSSGAHVEFPFAPGSSGGADGVKVLAERSSVITVEIEHVDVNALENVAHLVQPSTETLRIVQDKWVQKKFLRDAGVPV